jgi:small subunit ribosomal protein S5
MEEKKPTTESAVAPAPVQTGAPQGAPRDSRDNRGRGGARPRTGGRDGRKGGAPRERTRPEFDSETLEVRRVARVVAGGRRFNFSVAIVAGNRRGMVGVGLGKAGDTALAIDKAMRDAKKHMIKVNTTKDMSIPHEVTAKYSSARIKIEPSKDRGMVAGSAVRIVLDLAGIKNVAAKIHSPSKNKLSIARATVAALQNLYLEKPISKKA